MALSWLFWACFLLLVYTYALYPGVLFVVSRIARLWRRAPVGTETGPLPAVSMIIPAHNEERHLPEKLENLAAREYPNDRLELLSVSAGATHATNQTLCA